MMQRSNTDLSGFSVVCVRRKNPKVKYSSVRADLRKRDGGSRNLLDYLAHNEVIAKIDFCQLWLVFRSDKVAIIILNSAHLTVSICVSDSNLKTQRRPL
jgi:hypothetical protein